MALLTEEQLHDIRELIRRHHLALIAAILGSEALTPQERTAIAGDVAAGAVGHLGDAHTLGRLLQARGDQAPRNYADLQRAILTSPTGFAAKDRQSLDLARQQAGQFLRGVMHAAEEQTIQLAIDTARAASATDATAKTVLAQRLGSAFGKMVDGWKGDWERTTLNQLAAAVEHGVVSHIQESHGDGALVAKIPGPAACAHCLRIHIGEDGMPRIFPLAELIANGTNAGRKKREWLPVVGPTHPSCWCQLVHVPAGHGFDTEGNLVLGGVHGLLQDDFFRSHQGEGEVGDGALGPALVMRSPPPRRQAPDVKANRVVVNGMHGRPNFGRMAQDVRVVALEGLQKESGTTPYPIHPRPDWRPLSTISELDRTIAPQARENLQNQVDRRFEDGSGVNTVPGKTPNKPMLIHRAADKPAEPFHDFPPDFLQKAEALRRGDEVEVGRVLMKALGGGQFSVRYGPGDLFPATVSSIDEALGRARAPAGGA